MVVRSASPWVKDLSHSVLFLPVEFLWQCRVKSHLAPLRNAPLVSRIPQDLERSAVAKRARGTGELLNLSISSSVTW